MTDDQQIAEAVLDGLSGKARVVGLSRGQVSAAASDRMTGFCDVVLSCGHWLTLWPSPSTPPCVGDLITCWRCSGPDAF